MKQNRFRSWVVWTAIAAQVFGALELAGAFGASGAEPYRALAAAALELLVLFGVLNDPTSKEHF